MRVPKSGWLQVAEISRIQKSKEVWRRSCRSEVQQCGFRLRSSIIQKAQRRRNHLVKRAPSLRLVLYSGPSA